MASSDDSPGSSTQKRYLVIDSTHYRPSILASASSGAQVSGKYTVHLNEPIVNAHEVSLISMSVPNDFFNVREGANQIIFTEINNTSGDGANFNSRVITVPAGSYTLNKLVDELNAQIVEATGAFTGGPFAARIQFDMTDVASADGTMPAGSIEHPRVDTVRMVRQSLVQHTPYTPADRYYYLSHPSYMFDSAMVDYRNSILHRLGFTQAQVPVMDFHLPNIAQHTLVNQRVMGMVSDTHFMAFGETNAAGPRYANYAGNESYDNLRINCNLVGKGMQTTVRGMNGYAETRRDDILAIVPMIAGPGSLNTYSRLNKGHMIQHMQSRAPITSLTISLTDDNGKLFRPYEHSDFVVVLEFTTVEQVPKIISEVNAKNQHQTFLSRHLPISLDSK